MTDKCLAEIKLHLPDALKQHLQDLAAAEDRKLSELVRVILEDHLYGAQRTLCWYEGPGSNRG